MSNRWLEATFDRVLISTDGFEALCDILSLCVGFLGFLNRVSRTPEGRSSRQCKGTCSGGCTLVLDTSCLVPNRRLAG